MIAPPVRLAAAAILLAAGIATGPVRAQNTHEESIDEYTCKEVMRDSGEARDIEIAFIHGYLLGKAGATKFDLETLEKQTDAFINRCLDNPTEKSLDAMMKVKG